MTLALWSLGCVGLALLVATLASWRRGTELPSVQGEPKFAVLEPSPWEVAGGSDLTAPLSIDVAPETPEPPAGARFRSNKDELVNGPIVKEVLRGLEQIPPLPRALRQILTELEDAGSSARSIGDIVATEPVVSAALLRIANSAATGISREIVTVDQAVTFLGFSTVRMIATRFQLSGMLTASGARGAATYDGESLWLHSMAVSQVAQHLALRVPGADPWLASTLGLLHDIGKLAINSQFPGAVAKLWQPGIGPAGESFLARERRLFGADHAFIGAFLAARWQLPEALVEAIRLHHSPGEATGPAAPDMRRSMLVVHVANQLVKYGHVYCEDMEIDIIPDALLEELGLARPLESLLDEPVLRVIQLATTAFGDVSTIKHPPRSISRVA